MNFDNINLALLYNLYIPINKNSTEYCKFSRTLQENFFNKGIYWGGNRNKIIDCTDITAFLLDNAIGEKLFLYMSKRNLVPRIAYSNIYINYNYFLKITNAKDFARLEDKKGLIYDGTISSLSGSNIISIGVPYEIQLNKGDRHYTIYTMTEFCKSVFNDMYNRIITRVIINDGAKVTLDFDYVTIYDEDFDANRLTTYKRPIAPINIILSSLFYDSDYINIDGRNFNPINFYYEDKAKVSIMEEEDYRNCVKFARKIYGKSK